HSGERVEKHTSPASESTSKFWASGHGPRHKNGNSNAASTKSTNTTCERRKYEVARRSTQRSPAGSPGPRTLLPPMGQRGQTNTYRRGRPPGAPPRSVRIPGPQPSVSGIARHRRPAAGDGCPILMPQRAATPSLPPPSGGGPAHSAHPGTHASGIGWTATCTQRTGSQAPCVSPVLVTKSILAIHRG